MSSVSKLRIAAAEERAFGVWAEKFARQRQDAYRAGEVQNYFETFQAAYPVITSMLFFGVIYVVTERTIGGQGAITAGVFVAVISAFGQFLGGMLGLGSVVISVLNVVPYYERLIPILEAEPEMEADRADPGRLSGDIEIDHLTFRYVADGPVILEDLSLKIRSGEMAALVGPSGSGKSTLIRLLLGFEQPESGTIYYDGRDLAGLDLDFLRQQFGVVTQHGQLVQGDVLSNIIGPWDLSQEEAWAAVRAAGLEEDIRAMPMGLHTMVSEDGGMFSGGQKQRLMSSMRRRAHWTTALNVS
jgi:ATP-binding cassette subfamily C protein